MQFKYDKYPEAEEFYRRVLAIRQQAYGPDDPAMASTAGMLGRMYVNSGKLAEAEPLLGQEVELDTKTLGPDDATVFLSLSILASVQKQREEYGLSEKSYVRMLQMEKNNPNLQKVFSLSSTYQVLSELAHLQGNDAQAALYREQARSQ